MKKIVLLFSVSFSLSLSAMEATVFQVGQGSSVLVSCPGERSLLVDAGSMARPFDPNTQKEINFKKIVSEIIATVIEKTPDNKLTIIVSHRDQDHSKWIIEIAQTLFEKGFLINFLLGGSGATYPKSISQGLEDLKKKYNNNCKFTFVADIESDDKPFVNHDDIIKKVKKRFFPSFCTIVHAQKYGKKSNELSIIVRVESDGFSILIPGDAPKKVTDDLLENNPDALIATVILAFHHGSSPDNKKKLIAATQSKMIAISAGMHKSHHHPTQEAITTFKQHCEENELTAVPHMLTTYYGAGLEPYKSDDQERPSSKLVAYDVSGYAHGPTTLPLYNTTNGRITITADQICYDNVDDPQAGFVSLACQTSTLAGFRNITALVLSNLKISDTFLKKKVVHLPSSLSYLDLRTNALSSTGIMKLIELLKNHDRRLIVKLDNNKPFTEKEFEDALKDRKKLLKKLNARASLSCLESDISCVETLDIGEDDASEIRNYFSRFYYYDQAAQFLDNHKELCEKLICAMTPNCRLFAYYDKDHDAVKIWDTRSESEEPLYVINNPDEKLKNPRIAF